MKERERTREREGETANVTFRNRVNISLEEAV